MGSENHEAKANIAKLHQPKGGAKGKGCLTRHQQRKDGHQCSHQWHALKKSEANKTMYNWPQYKDLSDAGEYATGARKTKKRGIFPDGYTTKNRFPYRNGPTKKGKEWNIGEGRNFNHYLYPWWHNAHHIVPNSTLRKSIAEAADDQGEPRLIELIKIGLLKGSYNLNGKVNMIILPMDKAISDAYGLPRHIKGHEGLTPGEKPQYFNHPAYNRNVQRQLKKVMDEYASMIDIEDHPKPPKALSAAKINRVSRGIFNNIKNNQAARKGAALSLDEQYPDPNP